MKDYLVEMTANLPYPVKKVYREKASHIGTAARRAIGMYRKDVKGRRIKELTIKVITL